MRAQEQQRDEFLQFGLEEINESLLDFGEANRESNGEDSDFLPSITSVRKGMGRRW